MAERKKDLDQQMVDMGADMTTGDLTDPSLEPMAKSDNPGGKLEDLTEEELLEVIRRAEEIRDSKDLDDVPEDDPFVGEPDEDLENLDQVEPTESDDLGQMVKLFFEQTGSEQLDEGEEIPISAKEGGSIEKNADFVKDDDEEPADPPPGATPEEVADDIPAYLSTGEYVLPANVVRYIGLERIVSLHKGALAALQQMEDLDIIENVDENGMVEEDDDEMDYLKEPKGVVKTTLVVAKPHPSGMMAMPFQQGGDIGDAMQESFERDQMDQFGDIGDALQEAEDAPPPGGGDAGGGLTEPAPGTKAREDAEKGFQQAQKDRGFFERLGDAFYDLQYGIPTPAAPVNITPEYKAKQMKQAMINAQGSGLTPEQIEARVNEFNKSLQMSPEDAAKSVGIFGPVGKFAGLGQMAMRGLVNAGVTVSPDFTDELADVAEAGQSGQDVDPLSISEKTIKTKEDETDIEKDPFEDAEYVPGVGYVFSRRKVKKVKPLESAELNVRRGGLMGQ